MNVAEIMSPGGFPDEMIKFVKVPDFLELVLRFTFNTAIIFVLIRLLYYPAARRKDYLFTYILIASVVFLLCFLLESVKLQIGFALGLFAIFGIIRYRTNSIPIKEMTYLFLIIGVSVINALTTTSTCIVDLLFSNIVLVFITFGLEKLWLLKHEASRTVIYEKMSLIKPENMYLLLNDLKEKTGIRNINRVEIGKTDFVKEFCELKIFYYVNGPENEISQISIETDNNNNE